MRKETAKMQLRDLRNRFLHKPGICDYPGVGQQTVEELCRKYQLFEATANSLRN